MKFKVGDKIRFKIHKDEWEGHCDEYGCTKEHLDSKIAVAKSSSKNVNGELIISQISPNDPCIIAKDTSGHRFTYPHYYFIKEQSSVEIESSDETKELRTTSDGFTTDDENWQPGKWLL